MTPPENTERTTSSAGTGSATSEGNAAPPWQRVAKDAAAASAGDASSHSGTGDRGDDTARGDKAADDNASGTLPTGTSGATSAAGEATSYQPRSASQSNGAPDEDTKIVPGSTPSRLFNQSNEATIRTEAVRTTPHQTAHQAPHQATQQPPHAPPPMQHPPQQPGAGGSREAGTGDPGKGRSTPVSALRRPGRGPRRASLQIKRFDPWSVLKLSLVLGVALFFVWMVAVGLLYTVLDGMGVWDSINGTYSSLVEADTEAGAPDPLISVGRVFGVAGVIGAINIVLISALTTVCAFLYNVSADMAGGLEVTLSERE